MKVLIIEDEAGITNFLTQGLREEGYEVISAPDGLTGLDMAITAQADVILLDWMLPGLSGPNVCKAIRERGIATPVIFLTARDTVQETIEGLKSGANDYIKKPFSFEELLLRISVQLRDKAAPAHITIGAIKIIPAQHRAMHNGINANLTQREFELLHYLIQHKNEVCTRAQIINDVWNIHFEYDTGVIDVFINAIRKKLKLDKEEDFIRTIRGIGYIAEF